MKRWIHASTENIDQKIKDYLAAWAHDNVKAGEEACSLKEFREQLKSDGLKYTDTRYDYYLACYNHMSSQTDNKSKSKKVNSSTSTRSKIARIQDRIAELQNYIEDCKMRGCDLEDIVDEQQELEYLEDELNFAWQDDQAEYNYALEQQEFNPDGSLKGYDDYEPMYASTVCAADGARSRRHEACN